MPLPPLPALAAVVLSGAVAQWLAWWWRLPAILPLLAAGFLLGPIGGLIDVDAVFGPLLRPMVSLAVALILFEGGLTLSFRELRGSGAVVRNLVTTGAVVTWFGTAAIAHWGAGVSFDLALLVGAILVLTGPTVVIPLVRHIRPSGPVGPILRWEGILIDPIGALLALLVFEGVRDPHGRDAAAIALGIARTLVVGGGLGLLGGTMLARAIRLHWLPDSLHVPVALATVAAVFTGCNQLQQEAGLLGVTVLGIVLANSPDVDITRIAEFKEDLGKVLLAVLFVVLGARLPPRELTGLGFTHLIVVAGMIVLVRPIAVFAATAGTGLATRHRTFLAAMAPRGIVAAAVSSEFALRLEDIGREDASIVASLVFAAIVGTVTCYGLLAGRVARWLGLAEANPRGILFVGADRVVREIAAALAQLQIPTLLVDTNAQNVQIARNLGLRAWHGSILSQRFDEIDLAGIGRLCAMTQSDEVNLLAVRRFRGVFEGSALYQSPPRTRTDSRFGATAHGHGRWLFGADLAVGQLQDLLARGATVKATRLTDKFGPADYQTQHSDRALVLFCLQPDGALAVNTVDAPLKLRAGCTIVALVGPPP